MYGPLNSYLDIHWILDFKIYIIIIDFERDTFAAGKK